MNDPHRDQWGNWEFSFSQNYKNGKLWIPEVDIWLEEQRQKFTSQGVPLVPLWPQGKKFAVCLTHDVDRLSLAQTFSQRMRNLKKLFLSKDLSSLALNEKLIYLFHLGMGPLKGWKKAPSLTASIEAILKIEKKFNVRSSFFFTIWPVAKTSIFDCVYKLDDLCLFDGQKMAVKDVIVELSSQGFDIGLHGAYFSAFDNGILHHQKKILEEKTSLSISTTRQHFLRYHAKVTPRIQESAGFRVDTTVGYNRNIGFRTGTNLPFHAFDFESNSPLNILQIPLTVMDGALFGTNSLEYNLTQAKEATLQVLEQTEKNHSVLNLLFHPDCFSNPIIEEFYAWFIEIALSRRAWVTNAQEIGEHWRQREMQLQDARILEKLEISRAVQEPTPFA